MGLREKITLKNLGIKALVYRILVAITMFVFAYLWTGSYTFSGLFTISWNILNTIEYYLFDIAWFRVVTFRTKEREVKRKK